MLFLFPVTEIIMFPAVMTMGTLQHTYSVLTAISLCCETRSACHAVSLQSLFAIA